MRSLPLAALLLVLLTAATRLPALLHPLPIDDEAVYSVVANEIVEGGKPYLDAVERKPPLLFYTYAAVYWVAGKYNWHALHIAALLWTLATMAGLYVIARRLFDPRTGLIAALLYSLFQPGITFKNLNFDGELLMNLPIVWAWAIAFSATKKPTAGLFLAGVLSCAAFLLKQPAAIAAVPLGIYLLLPSYRRSRCITKAESLRRFAVFALGFWFTLAIAALVLQQQGILRDAIYWTIRDHASPHFFLNRCIRDTRTFVLATLPLLFAAAVAGQFGWKERRAEWIALLLLTLASVIGVSAGGRFYSHYYIQLLPGLTLLAAPVFSKVFSGNAQTPHRWLIYPACVWLLLTTIIFPLFKSHQLSARREATQAGRYLREHHLSGERLFVWGEVAKIYLEAEMRPACRYIMTYPLTGYIFGGPIPGVHTHKLIRPGAWDILQQDFAKHPPAYIVDVQNEAADYTVDYRIVDFPILQKIIERDYVPEVRTAEGVIYRRVVR